MFTYNNNSFVYLEICLRLNRKILLMIYRIYQDLQLLGNYIYVMLKAYIEHMRANVPFSIVWKMNDKEKKKRLKGVFAKKKRF